ncbi:MAG: dTDP-4-dehydrorhamnose reductase [Acidimicrobiales bacterium]
MRILVTGSNGQLGTELQRLLEPTPHEMLGVDIDTCDISDRDQCLGAITGWSPDLIIHGAALTAVDLCETEPELAYRVNSLATRFIADGARRVGAHVVYVSTDYVFDGTKSSSYVEWDEPDPQSVYGRSKLGGEREIDPEWTVARTSWVCSAHGKNMVKTVLSVAAERDELTFVDDQVGHPTFASDLAAKLVQLGVARAPGIHHVTNLGAVSWYEFVRAILEAGGHHPDKVKPISTADFLAARPADAPPMATRPANSVLDNFALRNSGFGEMRDYHEPLAEVVAELTGS